MERFRKRTKKILIGTAGGIVVVAGLIMVPYPGPGWLTVFAGLAILSTEFVFARTVLEYGRTKYNSWTVWFVRQHWSLRLLMFLFTCAVVLSTLWLLNVFGLITGWLGLPYDWLVSPIFR